MRSSQAKIFVNSNNGKQRIGSILSSNRAIKKMFWEDQWEICTKRSISEEAFNEWGQIFEQLTEVHITLLTFPLEGCDSLLLTDPLKMSQKIKMPQLQKLHLGQCNILSIEAIAKLDADNLTELSLSHNKIVSVRPLKRCLFRKLNSLWLNSNKILDFSILSEVVLEKEIKSLIIDFHIELQTQSWNISWVAKFSSVQISMLYVGAQNMIKNRSIQLCLKQKYKKGHFGPAT